MIPCVELTEIHRRFHSVCVRPRILMTACVGLTEIHLLVSTPDIGLWGELLIMITAEYTLGGNCRGIPAELFDRGAIDI
jgi:hypothetical protein